MSRHSEFIRGLPKAELHMHVEGSLEPSMLFALARRNRVPLPFASVEALQAAYKFTRLQDFLDLYYQGAAVLRTEEDFHDLTFAYFQRAAEDAVRHAEIFFDPQTHTGRGLPIGVPMEGILRGMAKAERELGISSGLILCVLRHLPEADAILTLRSAEPWLDRIVGIGLDSSELGHPPADFSAVFQAARERGLKRVAHAGEEGPPEYVTQALDILQVQRIDHGNRALESPTLIRRLREEAIPLTVCPLSNLKLRVVSSARNHPIRRMMDLGLRATLNSDDPAYFGGYVNANYEAVAGALGRRRLVELAKNSFTASFLPPAERERHLAEVSAYAARP